MNDLFTGFLMGVIITLMITGLWYIIVIEPDFKRAWKVEDRLVREIQEAKRKYESEQ